MLLNQEKERLEGAVQELLQAYSNLQLKHQEKVKEWNMTYKNLQDKYRLESQNRCLLSILYSLLSAIKTGPSLPYSNGSVLPKL